MPVQRFDSSTLSLITVDLLGEDAIEQVIETRHVFSHALACQWMGINIQPKTWSDTWLVNGLALHYRPIHPQAPGKQRIPLQTQAGHATSRRVGQRIDATHMPATAS